MSSSETLVRAALNRLKARFGEKVITSFSEAAAFLQETPLRIKEELNILKEEIIEEAERLNDIENEKMQSKEDPLLKKDSNAMQNKIDRLRAKVANSTMKIEELN